jgi:hypothetical protein
MDQPVWRGRLSSLSVFRSEVKFPLDMGEKSAIVKIVDVNVAPDQPPSTLDSVASAAVRRRSSGSVFLFDVRVIPILAPALARAPRERHPHGLT